MPIKLLIADDHKIVREGLKQLLDDESGFIVLAEAKNGLEAVNQIRGLSFDVVVLDMSMPGISGIELIKQIKRENPKLPVLVLSMHKEEQYAVRSLKAGASGYLTKETAACQLIEAIKKVASGGMFISAGVAERLAIELGDDQDERPHERLSNREYQIFSMIVSGATITGIANDLCLSSKTVSTHKARILQKMKALGTAELVSYAIRNELLD